MISFSGIDCGGKSTQIDKVAEVFSSNNRRYKIIHSRGGYTPALEAFKSLIRRDKDGDTQEHADYRQNVHGNPKKRKLLLWASILDIALYYGVYFRCVEFFGKTILADRYFWDSYIDFNMKYSEFDFENWRVWRLARAIFLKPKYSIIYTIPAELSMYRSTLKEEPWPEPIEVRRDRIERYMMEISNKRWEYVVDATGSIEEVFGETMRIIGKR